MQYCPLCLVRLYRPEFINKKPEISIVCCSSVVFIEFLGVVGFLVVLWFCLVVFLGVACAGVGGCALLIDE